MATTAVRAALQLTAGEHVIRVRHASGGWFTLHPINASAGLVMVGSAAGVGDASAELGTALEVSPTPTLTAISPNPVTIGGELTISGTVATVVPVVGSAAGVATAQATPTVLEPTATPILASISPNPVTIGGTLTIAGTADSTVALGGTAAGAAAAGPSAPTVAAPLSGVAAGAGGASASGLTVESGGGGALVPANASFDTDITATTEQDGAWWRSTSATYVGSAAAGRLASAEMTGSYVGRVYATGGDDGESGSGTGTAQLLYKFTAAAIDATTGVLSFDVRYKGRDGSGSVWVTAYDSGGASVTDEVNLRNALMLFGSGGSASDTTTLADASGINVTVAKSFDLKAWISARLATGKAWADVAKVIVTFQAWCNNAGASEFYIDNFR